MFQPEVFQKQMYCIEESLCDIVEIFRRLPQLYPCPQSARGITPPCPSLITPLSTKAAQRTGMTLISVEYLRQS